MEAPLEARRHFLNSVGLTGILAAIPPTWRHPLERRIPAQARLTQALRLALSTNIAGEATAALEGIRRLLEATGASLHDVEVVVTEAPKRRRAA
jgi:hypothetical protein